MCLAIPGKIIELKERTCIVQYPGESREVLLDPLISVEVGDYVRVQMKMVIEKIDEQTALASQKAWEEVT